MQNQSVIVNASSPVDRDLLGRAVLAFGDGTGATEFGGSAGVLALVDVDGDELVGWCWGYVLPRPDGRAMAYLHQVEVAATHRRRGVGTALVRAFASAAADTGAFKMFLTTGETNLAARRIYDAIGGVLADQGPTVNYWFALPLGSN